MFVIPLFFVGCCLIAFGLHRFGLAMRRFAIARDTPSEIDGFEATVYEACIPMIAGLAIFMLLALFTR